MNVLVIGAGIGGLALACGLLERGFEVVVYERDRDLADTGGYHLHLHTRALAGLRRLLDAQTIEQLYASAADGKVDATTAMRDHRGRLLTVLRSGEADQTINIDRITLRLLLGRRAGPSLRLGAEFVGASTTADGRVEAHFADGTTAYGDVLVGADGVGSRVARLLSGGRSTSAPVGLIGIGGFTAAAALPGAVAARLRDDRSNFAVGPAGTGLYIGYHDPVGARLLDTDPHVAPATPQATYIWGAMVAESDSTTPLLGLVGPELRDATVAHLTAAGWSNRLTTVIDRTREQGLAAFRLHAADARRLAPWPAGRICALGDAVHAIPPTGGQGAATAIMDADVLCRELVAVQNTTKTTAMAINDFHLQMRPYAATAIEQSMGPVDWMRRCATPLGSAVLQLAAPVASGAHASRRWWARRGCRP